MAKVKDYATYVRSKNAGPFWVTVEIFCKDKENYEIVKHSKNINIDTIISLYGAERSMVKQFHCDSINVIKFSWPRKKSSGSMGEFDMHFGQQYVLLAETEVEL